MPAKSRTLILDAQLFQSYTFHRGMGKYSLSLIEQLAERLGEYTHKILVFNNISGYLSDEEMDTVKKTARGFSFEFLGFKHLNNMFDYKEVKEHNRTVIDKYIAERLPDQEVDYMILSLFQETEVSVFPTQCARKGIIVYDLIPLQFFDPYLKADNLAVNYLSRYDTLIEADHFFPISQSVATDLTLHLGVPASRVTPIFGAPHRRRHLAGEELTELKDAKIILFPSGEDFRKNNHRTIKAFDKFNKTHGNQYTLVITSAFSEHTTNELKKLSRNVFFTGNVKESQLAWLYDKAELVLFLSYAEGLGLPILEAVEFDKKVLCSDIAVFKEINDKDLYFCDPYKEASIMKSLGLAINGLKPNKRAYKAILDKYNWESTADKMAHVLKTPSKDVFSLKTKVAVFGPKPSGFSGIGKVIQEQHYELSRIADVVYYFEQGISDKAQETEIRKNYLEYATEVRDPWTFTQEHNDSFDKVIYHIGNGEYHVTTLIKALSFPDTVVLHDTRIRGLYNVVRGQGLISEQRYIAEDKINTLVAGENGDFLVSLVNKQKSVIVHSMYAEKAIKSVIVNHKNAPNVKYLKLALPAAYHVDTSAPKDVIYVAMAGLMTESKGIDLANKITKIEHNLYTFKVKIFGFSMLEPDVVRSLAKNKSIELIKSPTDTRYLFELEQSNVLLNFRHPYHGETSYSTLEGIRFGKNVIINNTGWFSELPDELVNKVNTVDEAVAAVSIIADNFSEKKQSERVEYIKKNHSIEDYLVKLMEKKTDNAK